MKGAGLPSRAQGVYVADADGVEEHAALLPLRVIVFDEAGLNEGSVDKSDDVWLNGS